MKRIAIMGGTFDPIHLGHLACAEMARDACGFEQVLFVVAGDPNFKQDAHITDARLRLAMVDLAIAGNAHFASSAMEVDRPGITYTADTLEELAKAHHGSEISFIVGADALLTLHAWKDAERIAHLARIIAVTRPGFTIEDEALARLEEMGFVITVVEAPLLAISSSEVRERVARGETVRYLVPDAVRALIDAEGLYRERGA